MALYSFDGTGNDDRADGKSAFPTNVVKFRNQYPGARDNYIAGVGTRMGLLGKAIGGLFGAGGRTRIAEMYDRLVANWQAGDHVVDIIGFSRGAALAVHFSNVVTGRGIRTEKDEVLEAHPRVRFLGLWDVVGSFGIPMDLIIDFHNINVGWNLTVGDGVDHCFHAMALHERRQAFDVTRLNADHKRRNVEELWFRGVHSDVGGGNPGDQLSNVALKWMFEKAIACGLPIPASAVQNLEGRANPRAPLYLNRDLIDNGPRKELPGDGYHPTAVGDSLANGVSVTCEINSPEPWNWAGLRVEAGAKYQFGVPSGLMWHDGSINCNAAGWRSEDQGFFKSPVFKVAERWRRVPEADWFEMIGSVGQDGQEFFRIGLGTTYTPKHTGELYAFANDLPDKYGNNEGSLPLTIKRIG